MHSKACNTNHSCYPNLGAYSQRVILKKQKYSVHFKQSHKNQVKAIDFTIKSEKYRNKGNNHIYSYNKKQTRSNKIKINNSKTHYIFVNKFQPAISKAIFKF